MDSDPTFYSASCVDWLINNINNTRAILFAVTCWILCKSRNALIFQDKRWTTWNITNQVQILFSDVINNLHQPKRLKLGRQVNWDPPNFPFAKLNIDGSSLGNPGDSGFGGIIRDHCGNWISSFFSACGVTANLKAELFSIYYGLQKAWDDGFRHVLCGSDSILALQLVQDGINEWHPYYSLVRLIHSYMNQTVSFKHTLREGNACADWLAKYGSTHDDVYINWNDCPSQVNTLVLADKMGVVHFRP